MCKFELSQKSIALSADSSW